MRTLLAALTALMLFATPVVAGDFEEAENAWFSAAWLLLYPEIPACFKAAAGLPVGKCIGVLAWSRKGLSLH